jgi:class 3 adenylate cyclase
MEIFGIRPVDAGSGSTDVLQDEDARRKLIVGTGALLALLLTLFYTVLYVSQRWWAPVIFHIPICSALAAVFFVLRRNASNTSITVFFIILIAQLFIASNVFLGQDAGVHYFLFCILPFHVIACPQKKDRSFIMLIGAADLLAFVFTEYAYFNSPYFVDPSAEMLTLLHLASTTGTILLISGLVLILYLDISRAKNALAREHQRSEALLLNILPGPIAHRLKSSRDVIAETFREASVLFADIAGFTALAARFRPEELVSILNRYFSGYDELAEKYGVEKIKTIGDAYMVAAGIPEVRDDHAAALMNMALDMIEITGRISRESGLDLAIRIGMNSGEVTAGVIGKKKFVYDLWGDTVNVASRMESHGLPGRIQVSPRTYHLLRGRFPFEHRGTIEIKGMGRQDVYLLKN